MPELNKSRQEKYIVFDKGTSSPTISSPKGNGNKRPSSLISHFIEEFKQSTYEAQYQQPPTPLVDYEYSEVQLDDGRYIDMNENGQLFFAPLNPNLEGGGLIA